MATLYVYDSAPSSGTPFNSWSTAATTLEAALEDGACIAGSTIYVDARHSEAPSATVILTSAGTSADPVLIISATYPGSDIAPTTYESGGSFVMTGGSADLSFQGCTIIYGMTIKSADNLNFLNSDQKVIFHDCVVGLAGTSSGDIINFDGSDSVTEFHDCDLSFAHASQGMQMGGGSSVLLKNCTTIGTGLTNLVNGTWDGEGTRLEIENCDFSNQATNAEVIGSLPTNTAGCASSILVSNTKLRSTSIAGVVTAAVIGARGARLESYNTSNVSGGEQKTLYVADMYGVTQGETTIHLDTDNVFSLSMATTADAIAYVQPHYVLVGEVYAAAGATIAVEVAVSTTALKKSEFWIDVQYPTTSDVSFYQKATSKPANILDASPGNLSAGTTWTTGPSSPVYGTSSVDLTGLSGAGVVQVWAFLAKPSVTAYVDSKIVVT